MLTSDLNARNSLSNENPTHGVPAFQIEMANMASAAGRSPISDLKAKKS